ncbi:MAG: nucleoside hydrolase [Acidobacteriaceae bacterium]|nr:nucleoside hydrolase [Acidobacteriaceae bacterium]
MIAAMISFFRSWIAPALFACAMTASAQQQRMVLIDQDGSGPGGSNQMAMMVLLQSPEAKVLGITMVSGNAWEPEEVAHTLRMLELIHRTDVPVVPGAVYPLVRDEQEARLEKPLYGTIPWYGAWGDLDEHTSRQKYHPAMEVPPLPEGNPTTKPLNEDAAHFLIRQVHAHPHQVTIYAAGPLTNIALALRIDPEFAELSQGIVLMGGSLSPVTSDPEFSTHPRHEFNFWFDPEAAHMTLRAHWPRIDLTTTDISVKTQFTEQMLAQIGTSHEPAAQYLVKWTGEFYYLWDELEAAAWLDPKIITRERELYVDVDLNRGPNYGDTLTWTKANKPQLDMPLVHVQEDLDTARFYKLFVELMKAPPQKP